MTPRNETSGGRAVDRCVEPARTVIYDGHRYRHAIVVCAKAAYQIYDTHSHPGPREAGDYVGHPSVITDDYFELHAIGGAFATRIAWGDVLAAWPRAHAQPPVPALPVPRSMATATCGCNGDCIAEYSTEPDERALCPIERARCLRQEQGE